MREVVKSPASWVGYGYAAFAVGLVSGPLIVGPVAEFIGLHLSLLSLGIALSFTCAGWLALSRRTGGKPWDISAA